MADEPAILATINNDVAVVAALQQSIEADRIAVEASLAHGLPLIEGAADRADTLSASLWGMTTENRQLNSDIIQHHGDIQRWHDAHEADKLQLTAMKNEMEVLHDSVADLVNQSPAANV
ncbi:hypothetical protein, partial [Endozoicomonas atrinae]|uniref:hypothetical protein n=1 Tax=Endozoicomonas atrinae TaxID=1333660 RepID=UPI000B2F3D59